MRIGVFVATALVAAGCASDPVVVSNEKGRYHDFREQFIAERPADWPQDYAVCVADAMIPKLDPVALGRMNAAARGDIQLTASEHEQLEQIMKVRLEDYEREIFIACNN
jgi:hypothetical protein